MLRPPRVLVLHLKRFLPVCGKWRSLKRNDKFQLPLAVELAPFLSERGIFVEGGEKDAKLELQQLTPRTYLGNAIAQAKAI